MVEEGGEQGIMELATITRRPRREWNEWNPKHRKPEREFDTPVRTTLNRVNFNANAVMRERFQRLFGPGKNATVMRRADFPGGNPGSLAIAPHSERTAAAPVVFDYFRHGVSHGLDGLLR